MKERILQKELPGGAVLLEKELVEEEPLRPIPKVECAVCWRTEKRHRPAAVALKDDPVRFVPIDADLIQPFMGLCARHARKTQKTLKQRVRKMQRYTTNLYAERA